MNIKYMDPKKSLIDMVYSMIDMEMIPKSKSLKKLSLKKGSDKNQNNVAVS